MCRPVPCPTCNKTTWAGCGQHVDQVKASVPANQWCTCEQAGATAKKPGLFAGLFGR